MAKKNSKQSAKAEYKNFGRPPLFNTPKQLQNKIDKYFNEGCKKKKKPIKIGNDVKMIEVEIPTISGLAYFLGFESRQSFYDYENRPNFSYTIKRARLFIEKEYEEQLHEGNVTGAIFALKNMGWVDAKQIDLQDKRKSVDEVFPSEDEILDEDE